MIHCRLHREASENKEVVLGNGAFKFRLIGPSKFVSHEHFLVFRQIGVDVLSTIYRLTENA